jgi:hypothetical protein
MEFFIDAKREYSVDLPVNSLASINPIALWFEIGADAGNNIRSEIVTTLYFMPPSRMKLEEQSRKVRKMIHILRARMHAEKLERKARDVLNRTMRVIEDEECEHVGQKCMCRLIRLKKLEAREKVDEIFKEGAQQEEDSY